LLYANYAAATVLISLGSVSGLASPIQMIVMTLLEIPIFAANEYLSNKIFMVSIDLSHSLRLLVQQKCTFRLQTLGHQCFVMSLEHTLG